MQGIALAARTPADTSGVGTAKLDMAGSASAPLLSTPGVSNPAERGEDDEIQAMEGTEWQVFQSKSTKKKQAVERGMSQPNASRSSQGCIIVRPRDGLDLRKTSCYGISTAIFTAAGITAIQASSDLVCPNVVQNIVVVCTEKEDNARKILALKYIRVNGKEHEVAVYAAAEGNYVKGVIRNVERYIRVGQAIVRCYLYKKQMEVCSKCTRVGHRADVCPTPMVNVCHSCGAKDPKQGHSCLLRGKLCGKGHTTGDKACKQKYQTPFVIRQRRKEREMERAFDMDLRDFPTLGAGMPRPSSGGWLQPFTVGGGSALPVTAKWASKAQNPETYRTQAGPSTQVSGGTVTANESEELKKVRNENAKLSSELAQVKKELASLKNAVSASRQDGDQNGANGRKRRAVGKNMRRGVLILNVYSSPRRRDERFYGLIGKAVKMATDSGIPLIVAGDFNAPHSTWGYVRDSPKGTSICKAIQDFNLMLLTDCGFPTRLSNSVTRPSTPDLSLVAYGGKSSWRNMDEDLGSDHFIIETTLHAQCKTIRIQRIIDWDLFRSSRRDKGPPKDYEDWIETRFSDVAASTKEIELEDNFFPTIDSHLAHLFEAKKALKERWLKNKLNRSLRKRIAKINAEIASYSKVLEQKHWVEMCDKVDGQMRRSAIEILVHRALTLRLKDSIMTDLARIHLPLDTTSSTPPPGYAGSDSDELDGDIAEWESAPSTTSVPSAISPSSTKLSLLLSYFFL
ncbi:hypothetical protein HPB52_004830 [Rhipicephalus sanguineus]|uniref:Endonuclease/exonuclease/phosphatase domain-containing protein n=1 Tax=Rhipicephalus sanguineus TaxID=34632 RepID=A0A9D4PVF3_RHISA|nr:hypothetical protein HPB52_004830 [Rhipicephalus sanguineus]